MKIFIICSKRFYGHVQEVQEQLERAGHKVTLPNSYEDPGAEERYRAMGPEEHAVWKASMLRHSIDVIANMDAVLVLNHDKDGAKNYIGGATFTEMYEAFRAKKKMFLLNPIPEGILRDEILGFEPIILNGDLGRVS